jgi:hypothetical protein
MLALLLPALLSACSSPPAAPRVSQEGRRLCRERMAEESTVTAASRRFRSCLEGIDAEIAAAAVPATPPPAAQPPRQDPYFHCRRVQRDVIATEQRRLQSQPRWIVAAANLPPTDREYIEAKQAFDAVMKDFDRLIPVEMRNGAALLPDAVRTFMRCDREEFQGR